MDFAKTLAFSSYGWLTVMAVQPTAILLCHAQPFNRVGMGRESRDGAMAGRPDVRGGIRYNHKTETKLLQSL